MTKRTDLKTIAVIGAGPIIIGQACEFDYSGAQACKALREDGYRVILINSNPATIMTDPDMADATYIEPITPEIITKVLEKERPEALLATMGGQTALNAALALAEDGTLERLGIELIGANRESIAMAEDRQLFRDCMDRLGLESPKSQTVNSLEDAMQAIENIGLPMIIRPSFTMGGTGGGIAFNREEYIEIVTAGLEASPVTEVLVEESVLGWKEYEMEVVRDRNDNCIIICSIENIDPMGVHTGDSITVAPALTLTDREFQRMRNASLAVLRGIGIDTGGSNVQFAVNPEDGRMLVIEMNPRVSRSSALASKATGFPIAKIAAKLAVGYTLDELQNDITNKIPASFEPSIDYVVTKIPRFNFEKFKGTQDKLTTSMKSVGEVMAMGRCFEESLQKALSAMENDLTGLDEVELGDHMQDLTAALAYPGPNRIRVIAQAFRQDMTLEEIQKICHYDRWFLERLENIVDQENTVKTHGLPEDAYSFFLLKRLGFSDLRLAKLSGLSEKEVRAHREKLNLKPVYKRVDSCAAEFNSETAYFYSTYETPDALYNEARPSDRKKVIILGGGPNRIGQGIEFDYCCVHAAYAVRELGYESIMVNCNPETVSTDYDTSDRLYFEPITAENVLNIIKTEQQNGEVLGVIVQLGGQTPLKLCQTLEDNDIPVLGTSPDAIDLAEDRERFQQLLNKLSLKQPPNGLARTEEQALSIAENIGYPVIIRPSYVLGGRAMEIVYDTSSLKNYIQNAVEVSGAHPVLIDKYLQHCIEVDIDASSDGQDVHIVGVMEHIEEAGVHSGDSTCALPPHSLRQDIIDDMTEQAVTLAKGLKIQGLMNVQFVVSESRDPANLDAYEIYILEVNPRASRTVPFVAKATGVAVANLATRLMLGESLQSLKDQGMLNSTLGDYTAVKAPVFPFARFPGVDVVLGPEMKSTGEVMGIDRNFTDAFAKARLGTGSYLPLGGTVFISVKDIDKNLVITLAAKLQDLGFKIVATGGTAAHLVNAGIRAYKINKVHEGQPHVVDAMINGDIDLVINSTHGPRAIVDSFNLRRVALQNRIPYYTTLSGARAAIKAIADLQSGKPMDVNSLQDYINAA